jgi:hypothetical protein
VSVHVDLAIYCLISYVVTSPNALQENQILSEHFIGAIPHFKEFVAEESERVARYFYIIFCLFSKFFNITKY